jgi:hypothetical protein
MGFRSCGLVKEFTKSRKIQRCIRMPFEEGKNGKGLPKGV